MRSFRPCGLAGRRACVIIARGRIVVNPASFSLLSRPRGMASDVLSPSRSLVRSGAGVARSAPFPSIHATTKSAKLPLPLENFWAFCLYKPNPRGFTHPTTAFPRMVARRASLGRQPPPLLCSFLAPSPAAGRSRTSTERARRAASRPPGTSARGSCLRSYLAAAALRALSSRGVIDNTRKRPGYGSVTRARRVLRVAICG